MVVEFVCYRITLDDGTEYVAVGLGLGDIEKMFMDVDDYIKKAELIEGEVVITTPAAKTLESDDDGEPGGFEVPDAEP